LNEKRSAFIEVKSLFSKSISFLNGTPQTFSNP
jgi:hypothetical protein